MRLKCKIILFLLLIFSMSSASGQKIDSLLRVLHSYKKEDAKKLSLLNMVLREYLFSDVALELRMADTAIALGKKINDRSGLAKAYMVKGQGLGIYGDQAQALVLIQSSLDQFEALGNKPEIASCLQSMGSVYLKLREHNKALAYYNKALPLYEQLADKNNIASTYYNSGIAYLGLRNSPKSPGAVSKSGSTMERDR